MNLSNCLILLFIPSWIFARVPVREVITSDKTIKTVHLALGRSTILRFREKPTKIVIGNKNYFNIEYINDDITIQPLGQIDTNLFVYTKGNRTYSFLLKTGTPVSYDDIIHVRWKYPRVIRKIVAKKPILKPFSIQIDNLVSVEVKSLISLQNNSYILDCILKNDSKSKIKSDDVKIYLSRGDKKLKSQKTFYFNAEISPNEGTKTRLLFSQKEMKDFSFNVDFQDKKKQKIILGKYL